MKKITTLFLFGILCLSVCAQTIDRIKIISITPSENTGQDYSSWLSDDLATLVPNFWAPSNFKYIDVTLQLSGKSRITKLSLYDFEGIFTDNPATIYALNGNQKTLIGTFTGERYQAFVDIAVNAVIADAIVIHKYCNNIPQKVKVYGYAFSETDPPAPLTVSTILFGNLQDRKVGDAPYNLAATSNNNETAITFASSNPSIVSVSNTSGSWTAIPLAAGTANITASQVGNSNYQDAISVVRAQVVQAATIPLLTSVISFDNLPGRTVGDAPFNLVATSNNNETAISFSSSNPSVVSVSNSSGRWTATPLAPGAANITASQAGNNNYLQATNVVRAQLVQAAPTPPATGKLIPGRIEAESYDAMSGVQTEQSSDADGTLNVGWVDNGDWMDYNVTVATKGDYTFQLRVASIYNFGKFSIRSSNGTVLAIVTTPYTGSWQIYTTVSITVALEAGSQTIRIYADNNGWNLNWFEATLLNGNPPPPSTGGLITIDPKRWFQLTNASNGLDGLFDKKTDIDVRTGYGKIIEPYDSYYPVLPGEQIDIEGLRFFDGGGTNQSQPMVLSVITSTGSRVPIATFTGSQNNVWVGPDPNNPGQFNLATPQKNIKYIVINSFNAFPTEIEFFGNYTPGNAVTPAIKNHVALKQMFGVNGFEWNFEDPGRPYQIDEPNFKAVRNFTGFRHYMDWDKLENTQGSYTFNPTQSGGWNYDAIYDSCKARGIEVLACLKTIPWWMQNTYPDNQRDYENVPAQYGKDLSNPMSYLEQAKVAFQYAARYGSNKNVSTALLSVGNGNTIKIGLGSIKYIECDNERDKWWKGRKAYQTAFEYAANLSAFYDGNKNTMGPGVGIKNADPNMKVVMAGLALPSTDYVKGMIDWCRRYRGYRPDGTVDLCWDIINYHYYSNDSYASQNGNATRGAAPELSGAAETAADFLQVAHQYARDMPVWVTELGYDVNQGSIFKAIPIGNKSALQTQADWILRSSLLYARAGVENIFFYTLYDDNLYSSSLFSSSGLLNNDRSRKLAADYMFQANKLMGQYTYQQTIKSDPIVDRYELNGNAAYAIVVPDEKGRTGDYNLDLGNAAYAKIYTPKAGSDTMDLKIVSTVNGHLNITATETPVFVMAVGATVANRMAASNELSNSGSSILAIDNKKIIQGDQQLEKDVRVNPNPAFDFINVDINNKEDKNVSIKLYGAGSGKLYKNIRFNKLSGYLSKTINISSLPVGFYIIEIKQGNNKFTKKILKSHL